MPHPQSLFALLERLGKIEYALAMRDQRFWTHNLWSVRRLRLYKRWRHFYWRCLYQHIRFHFLLRTIRQVIKPSRS